MKQSLIILVLMVSSSFSAKPKVRMIDVKKVLADAARIQTVVVCGYKDTALFYRTVNGKDTLRTSCKLRSASEQFRRDLIKAKAMLPSDLAGKWPDKGDTVLAVFSTTGRIELFAQKQGGRFRFWDPNNIPFANSIFLIPKQAHFHQLPICQETNVVNGDYWTCTDGCLIDYAAITQKD